MHMCVCLYKCVYIDIYLSAVLFLGSNPDYYTISTSTSVCKAGKLNASLSCAATVFRYYNTRHIVL